MGILIPSICCAHRLWSLMVSILLINWLFIEQILCLAAVSVRHLFDANELTWPYTPLHSAKIATVGSPWSCYDSTSIIFNLCVIEAWFLYRKYQTVVWNKFVVWSFVCKQPITRPWKLGLQRIAFTLKICKFGLCVKNLQLRVCWIFWLQNATVYYGFTVPLEACKYCFGFSCEFFFILKVTDLQSA